MPNLLTAAKTLLGLTTGSEHSDLIHLAGSASIDVQANGAADKAARPAQVSISAYDGGAMRVEGFGPIVVDLAGMELPENLPLLADHDARVSGIVGSASAKVERGRELVASGTLTRATEAGKTIIELHHDGVSFQASIGAEPVERSYVQAGDSVTVNGRSIKAASGGFTLVSKSRLREISLLPIGASQSTSVAIAAKGNNDMTLPNTSTDQHAIGNDLDTLRTQRAAEHERIAKVEIAAKGHPGIAAQAIREGWSVDRAELEVLRASRGNAPSVAADAGSEQGTAIEAALCLSAGMRESAVAESIPEAQREQVMNAAVSRGYRGMGIQGAFRAVLAAAGESPGMGFTDATIRAAFEANQVLQASAGGFSTISLPGILSNSATKVMLGSYDAVATTWQQFCHVGSNTNFKAAKRYRMVGMGEFKEVGPDGELKHISLAEQEYDAKVSTKGAIIALTRQMIINDDLGAFMALPAVMGRMSAIAQDKAAYTLLLSNPSSFFASGNNNYIEGASTTLSIDSLAAAEQKFTEAVDDNGEPILVMPKVLIVPPALRTTGREIVLSAYVQRDQESDRQPTANVFTEKFDLAVSPWLGNSKITGNSQTAWYLAAGPGDVACMEMSFLNGRQTPTIESGETSFDTLGMQWRAYNDFGVSMGDHRAAFKSKGAS